MVPKDARPVIPKDEDAAWLRAGAVALLVCQPLFFFWGVLINPSVHIPFDIEGFHLPLISYVAQSVRHGIAPLWDPYTYGGMPIYADSQAQVFYPLTWLAILAGNLSQGRALFYWVQFLVPLHMVLAGLFAFWLLRRMGVRRAAALLGATVYQLGPFFASQAQHLGVICSAAWLPLAALAIFEMRRAIRLRWIAVLALAMAMSILAGFVAANFVIGIALVLLMAAWLALREARWPIVPAAAAGILLAALIASVELIPLWQLTHLSIASFRGDVLLNGGGLPRESLVSLVRPDFYHIFEPDTGYKLPYNYTFLYTYCGIATVFLLAVAPFFGRARERAFLTVTVLCVFWMLGEHTPVYHSIYVRLPSLLRGALYADYALMAFSLFAGITAALVLDRFHGRVPQAALWALALWTSYDLIHTGANRPMNSAEGGYRAANSEYHLAGRKDLLDELRKLVNQTYPPSRIDYLDDTLAPAIIGGDMLGLPTANGDNPFMLRRIRYVRRLFCGGEWWHRQLNVNRPASPLLKMLNAAWVVGSPLPEDQVRKPGLEYKETLEGAAIYHNPGALPRFFLTPRIRRSPDESATFQMLGEPGFNPAEEAVVEGIPLSWQGDRTGLATAPVTVQAYTPNRIELAVETSGPAFLATSEPMYPGWQAKVNGKSQPLWMTNGAFRGLALPAGPSQIVMEYRPPYLGFSLWFSGLLALVTMAAAVRGELLWRKPAQERQALYLPRVPWLSPDRRRWIAACFAAVKQKRVTLAWMALFLPTILLFYWKILLTRQFSLLTESEGVNQAYSWLRFWVYSIRHGTLTLWDPYTFAGRSFPGEMQTAAFYPWHLLLALFPLNRHSVISPDLYHAWWAGAHLLGACLMFLLAREFGLSRFAAFIAGICFSLGGFVGHVGWPHMLESAIWLPLILLFFLRAVKANETRRLLMYASLGGLAFGMPILAGGFHIAILQGLVVFSAGAFHALAGVSDGARAGARSPAQRFRQGATAALTIAAVGCAAAAIQLLPSIEYSRLAIRYLGSAPDLPANEKIPYQYMSDAISPHGIAAMVLSFAFNGNTGAGEVISPYLGVFPLLVAVVGIRRNWRYPWVRYLAGMAVFAFLYSLGPFSWLHGVLYAIVPKLWMAREAPRVLYLADFSLALLAAFGTDTLISRGPEASWTGLNRTLLGVVVACAVVLFVPAVVGKPEISPWISLSIVLIFASYGLFRYILQGNCGGFARFLMVALILFDLGAFDWTARNLIVVRKTGVDHLERNLSLEGASRFLKAQPGPFRVDIQAAPPPNLGDFFGIPAISGGGVTVPAAYARIMLNRDLLNVRYVLKPASAPDPRPVYQDAAWKVYENPGARPRAWVVHETLASPSDDQSPAYDPDHTALVTTDFQEKLEPAAGGDAVAVSNYKANSLEVQVRANARGLLVLSETFYPGWHAVVNGTGQRIYRVDGDLRGIIVPAGNSRVVLEYRPLSFYAGALLTLLAFIGTARLCFVSAEARR